MVILPVGLTPSGPDFQWQIQFPIIDDLSDEFSLLVAEIDAAVHRLNINGLSALKSCIEIKLKSKDPTGQGSLPSTADELMSALLKYWDFLNFEFAQLVVKYLADERLQKLMSRYEENVQAKVVTTLQQCRERSIKPEPPPRCMLMSIAVNVDPHSYSLHRILQMKSFLMYRIGLDTALFAGWEKGSVKLLFYIAMEDVGTTEHELKEHLKELQNLQVTSVKVFDKFQLDVFSGKSSEVRIPK